MTAAPVSVSANGFVFTGLQWGRPDGAPVLCLHGFPQRCTSWARVAERLAEAGLHVIAPDQRGYSPGARPRAIADYALPHLVADVVAMIEAIGAPVHLVGHDWGGVVGWQVTARRPDLVRTWTAVSTPNPVALNDVLARDEGQRARFGYIQRFREVGAAETALLARNGAGLAALYGDYVAPERVAEDVAFFSQPGVLTAALSWYRAMASTDADGLGPVIVPTAYLWGREDPAFGPEAAENTQYHVHAPYHFVPLDGASHWLPDEAPDTVAEVIAGRTLGV
jgi:pimeloyl-ACP methyl ester carboxylesterase